MTSLIGPGMGVLIILSFYPTRLGVVVYRLVVCYSSAGVSDLYFSRGLRICISIINVLLSILHPIHSANNISLVN